MWYVIQVTNGREDVMRERIERMVPAVQKKYEAAFAEKSWEVLSYQYEEAKARLVNKVRSLLPLIPFGTDQVGVWMWREG